MISSLFFFDGDASTICLQITRFSALPAILNRLELIHDDFHFITVMNTKFDGSIEDTIVAADGKLVDVLCPAGPLIIWLTSGACPCGRYP